MNGLASALHWLAISLWLGSMAGFGVLTAPALFRIVPSRQMAGNVAGAVIGNIDRLGLAAGVVILATLLWTAARLGGRAVGWPRPALIAVMLLLTLASATVVRGGLDAAQAKMDRPIEQYAATDPLRVGYNRWHNLSTRIYSGIFLLGASYVVIAAWRREG